MASRARTRLRGSADAAAVDFDAAHRLVNEFLRATQKGDIDGLIAVIHPAARRTADPASAAGGAPLMLRGAQAVAAGTRVFQANAQNARVVTVNGRPGLAVGSAQHPREVAIDARSEGVVALGLGGPEHGHPPEPFAQLFERGRAAGLHSAPHAGELVGPGSIRGAMDALGAERIVHGVRAIEDPALLDELAARQVALDVCPTSNMCLGVYPNLAQHPLPLLHAAGAVITIGSDDPALFATRLNEELALRANPFELDVGAIDDIILNAVRHSFLPAQTKQRLEATYRDELEVLKPIHLGAEWRPALIETRAGD
jgi:adenosine deaminase